MNIQFLEKNPFYLLDVMPTDTRATIVAKAEEKAFLLGDDICSEAQASLLNPSKRLSAEMDWFYDCDGATISSIRSCIRNKVLIDRYRYKLIGLSRLNATLFNFVISNFTNWTLIGWDIFKIDEQYSAIDETSLANVINACRTKAGLLLISCDEVGRELKRKREQIRHLISDTIFSLTEIDYIKLVNWLAMDYGDESTPSVIINGIVEQYELKMHTSIEKASNEITTAIARIKRIVDKEGIEANLTILIKKVEKWDNLVCPLQKKSCASGVEHPISNDIGCMIRDFALWLHNEQNMTEQAFMLVDYMKDVFLYIDILANAFENDAVELSKILNEKKEFNQIVGDIMGVKEILNQRDAGAITDNTVNDLIAKVKVLNARIKAMDIDKDIIVQVRTDLCRAMRNAVIYAHNEKRQTAFALVIAKMLLAEFGDIEELRGQLSEDVKVLSSQLVASNARLHAPTSSTQPSQLKPTPKPKQPYELHTRSYPEQNPQKTKKKSWNFETLLVVGGYVIFFIFYLYIFIIFIMIQSRY